VKAVRFTIRVSRGFLRLHLRTIGLEARRATASTPHHRGACRIDRAHPTGRAATRTHHYIEKIGQMEGCDWQDMQAALCHWAPGRRFPQQGPFTPTGANKRKI